MKLKIISILFAFCLFPLLSFAKQYDPKGPLTIRNQNPIYLQFANIEPMRAVALQKGDFIVRVDAPYSNIFEKDYGPNNTELLDMELLRAALNFQVGVYEGMEAGLEIPFIHTSGGFLDAFIQKYHHFFGFPNGGRNTVPNGQYNYYITENGSKIYDPGSQKFGLSDITLHFKHSFLGETKLKPAVAWFFDFKFPTGSPSKGTGSGNIDYGLGVALEKSFAWWHGFLNVGYYMNGGQKYLDPYIYNEYFSFVLANEFSVSKAVSLLLQVSGGTPLLHGTGMSSWDSYPLDLQLGAKGEHQLDIGALKSILWQAVFTEDLNANGPSVDFTVMGSLGFRFGLF